MDKKKIAAYYDYMIRAYWLWHGDTYAVHYGLWEPGTKKLKEALLNTNKVLTEIAGIKKGMRVLDAGCGIGGSSIWLAKHVGASVVGVSLSKNQISKAQELAKKNGVSHLTEFMVKDYLNTGLPDESFDVFWAVESACHAYATHRKEFLGEVYRLLKKGGKLIIADGFLRRDPKNEREKYILDNFAEGLVFPRMVKADCFMDSIMEFGLKKSKFIDKSKEVEPSVTILYKKCRWAYKLSQITEKLRLTPKMLTKNNLAGVLQYEGWKSGVAMYGIVYAEK